MRRVVGLLALCLFASSGVARAEPPGPDGSGSDYFVTIAARQCPSYDAIRANRARNNIQESLRDLGLDSPYAAGDPVVPAIEDATQPDCRPITGWRLTLGTGIAPARVVGPWGALSVVSGAYPTDITTQASIPDRDDQGRPLTGTTIAGATTIELTADQAQKAQTSSRLWLQGGTVADPVLAAVPEFADGYAFGALRCAIDNLNGDNVEWIQFPTGVRRVYCFAYYVTPPPTSGTIVIRKEVSDPPGATQTFTFEGNVSYTPDQRFSLNVTDGRPASATFFRAATGPGDAPWTVREIVPSGWRSTGLTCTSGASTVTTDPAAAAAAIALAAGDTVVCTFTNALRPPPGQLLIVKETTGGVGTFPFAVRGGDEVVRATATTTREGEPVDAEPSPIALEPGSYRLRERLPAARDGVWRQTAVHCNAKARRARRAAPIDVTIAAGKGVVCLFENRFVPQGSITLAKATHGGVGTAGFVISPLADPARQYVQRATTTAEDTPAIARGDSTRRLPLGDYVIQETATGATSDGRWSLVSVRCGDALLPFAQGRVVVHLTRDQPRLRCRFDNRLTGPEPLPVPPVPDAGVADLVVEKRAVQSSARVGGRLDFEVTVRNAGTGSAEQTVLADGADSGGEMESAVPSKGTCETRTPLICRIGLLAPGERATVRVRGRAAASPTLTNIAVAGSASRDVRLRNNISRVRLPVRDAGGGVCPLSGPIAQAAC